MTRATPSRREADPTPAGNTREGRASQRLAPKPYGLTFADSATSSLAEPMSADLLPLPTGGSGPVVRRACAACGDDEDGVIRRETTTGGSTAAPAVGPSPAPASEIRAHSASNLTVGHADDAAEREADAMAEQALMGLPLLRPLGSPPTLRRMCAACAEDEGGHGHVRRKAGGGDRLGGSAAPPAVASLLAQPGRSLDPATRAFFEGRFARSFGDVSIHDGPQADSAARSIQARAFTAGSHIAFARGEYAPGTPSGKRLLAHELAHVVQGSAPVLRRKPGAENPLTGVTLALVSADPPVFRATFAFAKEPVSFEVQLSGKVSQIGLREGTQSISASPFYRTDDSEVPSGAVVFTLPDQSDAFIWFMTTPENKGALVRASEYLQNHAPVMLTIRDATKDTGGEAGQGTAEPPPPKFTAAEDWLAKQMLPAVQKALAEEFASVKTGKLIPYQSAAIQASEGPDISMIQVNKPGSKAIAGHVRVDRRKWVGQGGDDRTRYARDTAAAIVARLTASARKERLEELDASVAKETKGEAFPAWAIKLKQAVDKKLAAARAAAPPGKPPQDIPDRLHLTHIGELIYFQLFLEREAGNAPGTMIWQVAIMTPSLYEDDPNDVDELTKTVRQQTALMRTWAVKSVEKSDEPERTNMLMRPIPADIHARNLNANGTTVTGATNGFQMSVRIDVAFSVVEGRDTLNMIGYSQRLGLSDIEVVWKVARLNEINAEDVVRAPPKPAKGEPTAQKSDVYFDLANREIDQRTKIGLAMQHVDTAALMASPAYPVVARTRGVTKDYDHEFSKTPGVYLVVAETAPRPLVYEKYRQVFPPSRAVLPVRVMTSQALAAETVSQRPDALAAKESAKSNPALTDRQRIQIDADIDRLKKQEGMTQLGVVQAAEADIDRDIARFSELRQWLITDRAAHPSVSGTSTEDPLVVRLSVHDRLHDTHVFDTFRDLYGLYGDHAFDISYLAEPIESKAGQYHVLNQHLKLLGEQKKEGQKLQGRLREGELKFLGGATRQVVATLVMAETGTAVPLLLLVGEHTDSVPGDRCYKIVDMTLSSTPMYDPNKQTYVGDRHATPEKALYNAFVTFGEDNEYDVGTVHYRYANDTTLRSVPNVKTLSERARDIAMFLAILGMIASVVATGGATSPAVAFVIAALTLANAALAVYLSLQNLRRRSVAGTLELDADAVLDVINILASVVGVGALAKGRQLNQAAQAARVSGNAVRVASALGKLERLGRNMLIFDTLTLGATAVVTGWKVTEDVAKVKALKLPPAEEAELLKQIATDAVVQGAMIAFQTVMLARSHYEMYRDGIEKSRYKSFEERGWVDADGNITKNAPPTLRAVSEGKPPPVGEKPPVALESDLPLVKAAADDGNVKRLPNDPDHDLEIPFRDENGEPHAFKRRREDGGWCRYSDPFCFFSKKEIDQITKELGDLDSPRPADDTTVPKPASKPARGAKGTPGKTWGKIGGEAATLTETLEATITQAIADLKVQIGKKWLLPHIYGTKLHKVAADLFRKMKLPRGWRAIIDQPLRKSGLVDPATAKLTVRQFLKRNAPWLIDEVPPGLLSKKVGDIEPDIILVAPDGTKIVWDLSPSQNAEHIAKTIVYANAIDSAGGRVQIGETFYRPEQNLELDAAAQSRFRGPAADAEGARITLNDDKARSLARRSFGQGEAMTPDLPADPALRKRVLANQKKKGAKPIEPLPAGYSGSVEKVTGDTVVGQYYDAKSKTWKDTKTFTIHYSEDGAYIRPEAP